MEKQAEESKLMNEHPRVGEYRKWLRENVYSECKTATFLPFYEWLKK